MALVLCQQCFAWVEPICEQCPQCDYPIDVRAADPPLEELASAIGPLVAAIGPVRLSRTILPDRGTLYATAHGLFFVPESFERVRMVPSEPHGPSPRRMMRAIFRAMWLALRNGLAPSVWSERSTMRIEITRHEAPALKQAESPALARLLMDHPGVLFVARRTIRTLRRTFSGWSLVRPNNLTLRVKPLGDRALFHERMSDFAADVPEAVCP